MTRRCPPLMSLGQLHDLEDSLGGETEACKGFVSNFVDMWTGRFQRLSTAIRTEDLDGAMDAALSLCAASHMVGAKRLEQCAEELIGMLRTGCLQQASMALPSMGRCGRETVHRLVEDYVMRA
ncbi:Hpt domain-containing protein [Arthrobacter wenxiniae]|uniref:Hpt domain-containing protein n=1 Tax=Arthrobacter wenxiniae TaxID=2713570 RepID=A0A7Y7LZ88_9MICC|nr:Hpt domain-containing protein [Arthrobacter wenxiniae]NVM94391.1 Hpt domain-containing protein [Arthrobacter wenxiniae]